MRLCRLMCGKALPFRVAFRMNEAVPRPRQRLKA